MTDTNVWQRIPPTVTRSNNNTTTIAGYSIPSQTANPQNLSIDEAVSRAKSNAAFLSEMISFSNPEIEDLSTNDVVQELYRDCVNLHDFINEQLWSVTDPQQISTLLSAHEEITAALAQYRKSTEHEELVAATRAFERKKMEQGRGDDDDDYEEGPISKANPEEERLALKMRPVGSRDFPANSPEKAVRHKPRAPKFTTDKVSESLSPVEIAKPMEPQPAFDAATWVPENIPENTPAQLQVQGEEDEDDNNDDWEIVKKDEIKEAGI